MATIRKGARGAEVRELQSRLGLARDGVFGPVTEEAVKAWQRSRNLLVTGVVGANMWGLLRGEGGPAPRRVSSIILHCTSTPEGMDYMVSDIDRWDRRRGLAQIGCHYVVYRDGSVHPGRDAGMAGAHCEGHNMDSIGVCYVGGATADGSGNARDTRTAAQRRALVSLVRRLMSEYGLSASQVHCHSEYADVTCPSFSIEGFRLELG